MEVPSGRIDVVATVLHTKERFDSYTGKPVMKMRIRVDTDEGTFEAWGSVPRKLNDGFGLIGQKIQLKATFVPSGADFAFFSRPTGTAISM